jgi:hypothetical protein
MDRYELAWAAGFFDGEGWADLDQPEGRRTGQPHARVNQADAGGVPGVLDRFKRALGGLGRIGGRSAKKGGSISIDGRRRAAAMSNCFITYSCRGSVR